MDGELTGTMTRLKTFTLPHVWCKIWLHMQRLGLGNGSMLKRFTVHIVNMPRIKKVYSLVSMEGVLFCFLYCFYEKGRECDTGHTYIHTYMLSLSLSSLPPSSSLPLCVCMCVCAGLVFRPPDSPIVLLIFASGKIVCTGGKSCNDIENGFRRLFPLIQPYIQNNNDDDDVRVEKHVENGKYVGEGHENTTTYIGNGGCVTLDGHEILGLENDESTFLAGSSCSRSLGLSEIQKERPMKRKRASKS